MEDVFYFGLNEEEPEVEAHNDFDDGHKAKKVRRYAACIEMTQRHLYRRAFSEISLIEAKGIDEFKDKHSYHFITAGDVDALSYLSLILKYQNLNHVLFSTWCMACEDVLQFKEWIDGGKIKKCDAYMGEIFPRSYSVEWEALKKVITPDVGVIKVFRNHSKIIAGTGPKFSFAVEMSCNINTNPRTENGTINVSHEAYLFYKTYYEGITSIV